MYVRTWPNNNLFVTIIQILVLEVFMRPAAFSVTNFGYFMALHKEVVHNFLEKFTYM